MTDELLPCPFCGGVADAIPAAPHDLKTWTVICLRCQTATCWADYRSKAIDNWNRRTEIYELGRAIKRLQPLSSSTRAEISFMLEDQPTWGFDEMLKKFTPAEIHAAIDAVTGD